MESALQSLVQLVVSLAELVVALGRILVPAIPLIIWMAFWLFAVDWTKLRNVLRNGGWIGLVLIGALAVLVWGTVAPPVQGAHYFLGLTLSNFVGKTVLVTGLICIMFLCGSAQLSGACGTLCRFEDPVPEAAHHGHSHGGHAHAGHDTSHGDHGHH